jgi:hypothetical protein
MPASLAWAWQAWQTWRTGNRLVDQSTGFVQSSDGGKGEEKGSRLLFLCCDIVR